MPDDRADTGMERTIQVVTHSGGWWRHAAAFLILSVGLWLLCTAEHEEHVAAWVLIGTGASALGITVIGKGILGRK